MSTQRRTKPIPLTSVKVKRAQAGFGLFATTQITAGMYIEYVGTIISNEKANKMHGARYLFEINSKWTIEGATRNNLARYINHSCSPNCESIQSGKKVYIKAIKKIHSGEELTYDYGKEYFNEFISPVGCVCKKCKK
jgi:SET domain-containing protein